MNDMDTRHIYGGPGFGVSPGYGMQGGYPGYGMQG
ncbi:spore coat protein, partial [Bacillus vallismortis]|nr:spore coat protein [Bacillus vallismortis]